MFGRSEIVKVIKKGDVDQLRKILDESPSLINESVLYFKYGKIGLLHASAAHNQPEIVKFLVNEKGATISKLSWGWTPLHFAVDAKSYEAVKALLELGGDPDQKCDKKTCFERCKDKGIKELMLSVKQERQQRKDHETRETQESFRQVLEAAQRAAEQAEREAEREAAARIAGKWTILASGDVVLERDYPEQHLRLIEIFDLAAECRTSVSKNLETGQPSPPKKESFDEISDKKTIEQARAQLAQANGNTPPSVPKLKLRS